jgi:WD40 repeat protein
MARLFISHSSRNNDKAIELRDWLAANGWNDVFLDLDPERGIAAGERWMEALQKAAYRCELVLALVSAEWIASGWCKSEVDAARLMGKKVIAALVGIDKAQVPPDLKAEQFIDLSGDPQAYRRLKEGLKRAGLDPTSFPFELGRRPYPGFAYLEEQDAAVFFGRDAQIVRGLDEVRRLARTGVTRMLVILGASGSGKSSFLRAGLWPRLKRDDLAWLPLPILRPERAAISGKYGLAQALQQVVSDPRFADGVRQRGLPRSRADIQDFIERTGDGLAKLLVALRDIAQAGASGENAAPPTILLALDQGEELFNDEGRDEATRFIDILTETLTADPRTLAILVMRSDSFPLLQGDPSLAALPKDTFTLDMMLEGSFRAVIEGPARLVEPPLKIDPLLADALLEDITGQDALPLLAFTLGHLYDNYRAENELTLAGYDRIGRVKGVIDRTVEQAFAQAVARGEAPKDAKAQLALARSAFIPHLAQVNAAGLFVRRVAARDQIPVEAKLLIDRFADQRLLIRDRRKHAEGRDVDVLEVAHEALLRQPPFSDWLADDREFLVWRERLSNARAASEANQRGLMGGRELAIARDWMQTRAERDIEPIDQAFIRDSVAADDKRRADEAEQECKRQADEKQELERRLRDAEQIAEEQNKALANLRDAQIAQSRFLADLARQQRAAGNPEIAVLLALEALPDAAGRIARAYVPEAELQLNGAWRDLRERLILNHRNAVRGGAFSPDGKSVVTASEDGTACIWDAETGRPIGKPIKGHKSGVLSAGFSRDGKRIVTASKDGTARIWDTAIGRPIGKPLIGHKDAVRSASFNPDGTRIVTASEDYTALVWDATSGKTIGDPLKGHKAEVWSAAFSSDGLRIVTASFDRNARIWDAASGKMIGSPLKGHDAVVWSAAFSPDGQRVVTASFDRTVRIWDAASGKAVGEPLKGHKGPVYSALFSPDGQRIVTASADTTARVWDAASGKSIDQPLKGHDDWVYSAAFSPDGQRILTASKDKTARVWSAESGKSGKPLGGHQGGVFRAAFSPDGKCVVTASDDRTARLWSAATLQPIGKPLAGHDEVVWSAAFSPDGKRIVTASEDMTARIWDVATGKEIGALRGHDNGVTDAAFGPDARHIVTGSWDETARLWDSATCLQVGSPLRGHDEAVQTAAFSRDGTRIVTASQDGTARLWDAATGRSIGRPLRGHNEPVTSAAFSPDGKLIVTASQDNTARLWDAASGRPIGDPLNGHQERLNSVAFSPDGKRIVTASADKTARIWDAATGKEIGELRGHEGGVESAVFSPDGKRIVTASEDKTARLWDIFADTQALVSQAKADVPRCLTRRQREAFFLPPEPPHWCIEMEKWPYNTGAWKQWLTGVHAGKKPALPAGP